MSYYKVVFAFISSINLVTPFFHSYENKFEYIVNELNETVGAFDTSTVNTKWLEQPVDHFNPENNRTWMMRYFERTDLWKEGKPIYLFLGGEGEASPVFLMTGTMFELAQDTDGALFMAEHRYYGKSKPFEDFTSENLEFLSSRQALADFSNLLKYIKTSPKFEASKVVVVGGSYSGNLAAWMKLFYPDLVDAAIASSAPVLAKLDYFEYLETVSDDFEQYGSPGCWDRIAEKFASYKKAFQTKEGTEVLKNKENICGSCDMTKQLNQELFFLYKTSGFMYISQYAVNLSEFNEYCDSNFTSTYRHFKELGQNINVKGECISLDFDVMIQYYKSHMSFIAWTYQTCTEFSYFQTGSSGKQPFTEGLSIELYYKMCEVLFGSDFDKTRVKEGVDKTNIRYGGLKPNVTKVVFVNGELDPWSKLSVLEDLSYEAPAKKISQSSHCRDLFSDTDGDSEELKEARAHIKYLIKSWIGEGEYLKKP